MPKLKRLGISIAISLPLLCTAGPAYGASTPRSPGDPPEGSPAGAVYQLPFEKGRADAAPKGTGGTGAPGGGASGGPGGGGGSGGGGQSGSGEPSLYRSENNFGSSSKVPGVNPGGANAGAQGAGGGGSGAGGNGAGGSGAGGSGTGGSGAGGAGGSGSGGGSSGSSSLNAGELTDAGNTSSATNFGLLLLIGLVAAGVGVLSVRSRRLRHR